MSFCRCQPGVEEHALSPTISLKRLVSIQAEGLSTEGAPGSHKGGINPFHTFGLCRIFCLENPAVSARIKGKGNQETL